MSRETAKRITPALFQTICRQLVFLSVIADLYKSHGWFDHRDSMKENRHEKMSSTRTSRFMPPVCIQHADDPRNSRNSSRARF
jgi:hypothetical protein